MRPSLATPGRWLGVAALVVALAAPALAQRNVTLRMNSATMPDTISTDPAVSGIQVRGNVGDGSDGADMLPDGNTIDWGAATTLIPDNVGGDYWEIDFQIPDNEQLDFKFYFDQSEGDGLPGGWEEGGNHLIEAGTGDVSLDLHYFEKVAGDQPYDWRPFAADGDSVAVWFRVYIDTEQAAVKGLSLDDENLDVGVRGNFGTLNATDSEGNVVDWGEGGDTDSGVQLAREVSDMNRPGYKLFSGVARYPASSVGQEANYKFFFRDGDTSGDGGYEDGSNRTFTVPTAGTDTTLHWVFYGNSPANTGVEPVTATTTFSVDITPLNTIGVFSTSDDAIQLRGGPSPTGWNDCTAGDNPTDDCVLTRIPGSLTYNTQQTLTAPPGTDYIYKYYVKFDPELSNPDFGYEEPLDYGGGNRPYEFSGNDETVGPQFFNGIRDGNIIADGQSVDVTFMVDMNPATTFEPASDAFDPATDVVTVSFRDPIWLLTQGIDLANTTAGIIETFTLSDSDGDGIYTGTFQVDGPTYNGIGYRYAFGNPADGTGSYTIEGTGGFDAGRRRYRYVTDVTADDFAFELDTFRATGDGNPLPWEMNPTSDLDPGDVPFSVPVGYRDAGQAIANETAPGREGDLELGTPYPNPSTGIARMRVTLDGTEALTVRVYDVTGRLVASVVEDAFVASGRVLEIDTAALAAGLYVVRAEAGGDVATRRLTVVR